MWQDKIKEIIYLLDNSDVNEIDIVCAGEFEKNLKLEGLWTKAKKLTKKKHYI